MFPFIVQIAGTILFVLLATQMALLLFSTARQLFVQQAQRKIEGEIFHERLAMARLQRANKEASVSHWNGTRKFRIDQKVHECENVCSFYLSPHDQKPLPAFQPGLYLTFVLVVPNQS